MRLLYFLPFAFYLISCDPGVEPEIIEIDKLYSINSFISPQDSIRKVYLYHASRLGEFANIKDAVVKEAQIILSNTLQADTLFLNASAEYYETRTNHVPIKAMGIYSLEIKIPGIGPISATCTVPPDPNEPRLSGTRSNNNYLFDVFWTNPQKHPYYVVSAIANGTYMQDTPIGPLLSNLRAQLDARPFPSDKQVETNSAKGSVANAFLATDPTLTVTLWNVDKNMFEYYNTWDDYDAWIGNVNETIPNLSEPKPIYSNVKNAIGIFAAYNTASTTIEIN